MAVVLLMARLTDGCYLIFCGARRTLLSCSVVGPIY